MGGCGRGSSRTAAPTRVLLARTSACVSLGATEGGCRCRLPPGQWRLAALNAFESYTCFWRSKLVAFFLAPRLDKAPFACLLARPLCTAAARCYRHAWGIAHIPSSTRKEERLWTSQGCELNAYVFNHA